MKPSKSQEEQFLSYLEGYKKLIIKVASAYCKNPEERKDLVQDIIVQLWKSYPKYNKKFALSTWTYRIALNTSISFLRKESTRKKTRHSYLQKVNLVEWEESTEIDERLEHLYRFIGLLKPFDRAVVILHLEGCSNKEIAEIMGLSTTNVSTKLNRIREKLKSYFSSLKKAANGI